VGVNFFCTGERYSSECVKRGGDIDPRPSLVRLFPLHLLANTNHVYFLAGKCGVFGVNVNRVVGTGTKRYSKNIPEELGRKGTLPENSVPHGEA
jgi:hypothetical protein